MGGCTHAPQLSFVFFPLLRPLPRLLNLRHRLETTPKFLIFAATKVRMHTHTHNCTHTAAHVDRHVHPPGFLSIGTSIARFWSDTSALTQAWLYWWQLHQRTSRRLYWSKRGGDRRRAFCCFYAWAGVCAFWQNYAAVHDNVRRTKWIVPIIKPRQVCACVWASQEGVCEQIGLTINQDLTTAEGHVLLNQLGSRDENRSHKAPRPGWGQRNSSVISEVINVWCHYLPGPITSSLECEWPSFVPTN